MDGQVRFKFECKAPPRSCRTGKCKEGAASQQIGPLKKWWRVSNYAFFFKMVSSVFDFQWCLWAAVIISAAQQRVTYCSDKVLLTHWQPPIVPSTSHCAAVFVCCCMFCCFQGYPNQLVVTLLAWKVGNWYVRYQNAMAALMRVNNLIQDGNCCHATTHIISELSQCIC